MKTRAPPENPSDRKVNTLLDFLDSWFIKYPVSMAIIFGYVIPNIIGAIAG